MPKLESFKHLPSKKILVPTDGSENAKKAEEVAVRLAKDYSAELLIVNVAPVPIFVASAFPLPSLPVDMTGLINSAEKQASKLVANSEKLGRAHGVKNARGKTLQPTSSIVHEVIQYASEENVDLIVIGTRGLGGFKKLLLGSVSSGVVTHADCNVLVVK